MFTRQETKDYMAGLDRVITEYAKSQGINITRGGAKYGEDIDVKLTFTKNITTMDGTFPDTKESNDFRKYTYKHGIPVEALFEEIKLKTGEKIRIMGYKTRSSKYPVIYTKDGANMKCTASYMKETLSASNSQYGV